MNQAKEIPKPPKNYAQCVGTFSIPASWLYSRDKVLTEEQFRFNIKLFKDMIILECRYNYALDGFDYVAIGPMFSELSESEYTTPKYNVRIARDGSVIFDSN